MSLSLIVTVSYKIVKASLCWIRDGRNGDRNLNVRNSNVVASDLCRSGRNRNGNTGASYDKDCGL